MENLEWSPFYFNGFETNIEATKCGRLRKVKKDWYGKGKGSSHVKYGEILYELNKLSNSGYYIVRVCIKDNIDRPFYVHQIIAATFLNYTFGNRNLVIDHINSDKFKNSLDNLRIITLRENCSKEKTLKSGMPAGVNFYKRYNKYVSRISYNRKRLHLGYFSTIKEAENAYLNKLKTLI